MSTRTTFNIMQLLPELLTEIFQKLDLRDRKNVRLACKSFYDACKQISIVGKEKFIFHSGYCIQDITKMVLSCQYLRLNLEFQGLSMDLFPGKIWTLDKIHSLTFYRCSINGHVFKNIIVNCHNLKHWKIWLHSRRQSNSMSPVIKLIKPFDELIKQKIIRKQLQTFEVLIDDKGICTSLIKKIFVIFPNIKKFGALYCCSDLNLRYLASSNRPSLEFTRIDKCVKSTNIDRLIFDVPSDGHWLNNPAVWDLRLKEIQTSLYYTDEILKTLANFFSHQEKLEAINLIAHNFKEEILKKLLFLILRECNHLKRLSLNYQLYNIIDLNEYEFGLLLQKRLKFLNLRFYVNYSEPLMNVKLGLPVNRYLHTLILNCHCTCDIVNYGLIIEYFQNLKHLDVCNITDEILQVIIKYQPNLEILKLNYIGECTDFGFTGRRSSQDSSPSGYSISRLKNLQCLDICSYYLKGFTKVSLLELIFPKLKHFHFAPNNMRRNCEIYKNFEKIAENLPELEVVILKARIKFSQLLDFCSQLKKLDYIVLTGGREIEIRNFDCKKLFLCCPSLRYVVYSRKIFINTFTRKMSVKSMDEADIHYFPEKIMPDCHYSMFCNVCTKYY